MISSDNTKEPMRLRILSWFFLPGDVFFEAEVLVLTQFWQQKPLEETLMAEAGLAAVNLEHTRKGKVRVLRRCFAECVGFTQKGCIHQTNAVDHACL